MWQTFLVKTFFIKCEHFILLSQLRNRIVNYCDTCKNHHCPSCRLNFLRAKQIPFEKEDSCWRQNSTLPSTLYFARWKCWLSVNEPDKTNYWRSLLQTFKRIHLDILLGQCTLVLLDYNPLNHILYSYHKIYFYCIKSVFIICTKLHSLLGSANANKTWLSSTLL